MSAAPSLLELQRGFAEALLHQNPTPAAAWVAGHGLEPEARLQIYHNIVFNNLGSALRTAYPFVLKLVGEPFFAGAADLYIRNYPSPNGNLQDYGAQFPELLARMPEAAGLPYLPDMARLEWARQESYLAADVTPLDATALAAVPEARRGKLRLALHPSMRLLESAHPLLDIWDFCQRDDGSRLALRETGDSALVYRAADGEIVMQAVSAALFAFLTALAAGQTLAAAEALARRAATDFDLAACLADMFTAGLIAGYQLTGRPL